MVTSKQQPDFDHHFWADILKALPPAMPLLEKLLMAGRPKSALLGRETTDGWFKSDSEVVNSDKCMYAMFINGKGRKATESDVRSINPEDYALYLDATTGPSSAV